MPDGYLRAVRDFEVEISCWRIDPDDDIGEHNATLLASLARGMGYQRLAYELERDIDKYGVAMTYDEAVVDLFGAEADAVCRARHLELDPTTRMRFIREIATAYRLVDRKLRRNVSGDYSPDKNASRFPTFVPPPVVNRR